MKPTIIVVGDIMLDHNIYTRVEKIANEAPIPVFNHQSEEWNLGGAGNVVKNLQSLGCEKLYVFGVIGDDKNGERVTQLVTQLKIQNNIVIVPSYKTTAKIRYFCEKQIQFRCDIENSVTERQSVIDILFVSEIEKILSRERVDCIVLSDYNKGVLSKAQCQSIIHLANRYKVMTCVDPKEDPTKYTGCTLIKPNRTEAYKLFKVPEGSSIEEVHRKIKEIVNCQYSVITLAERGITLYDGSRLFHERSEIRQIVDVTGAGDIVCCILAYYSGRISSIEKLLKLATRIATKSVEYPGAYTIRQEDISEVLPTTKLITSSDLASLKVTYSNKRIAWTNGCFDLLHSGHIELFKFCKSKGDIVIIGLNSDDSIKRLKGQTRPINSVNVRADILCAIQYIDHVIIFDEDSPHRILSELKPYYLIKGGDYAVDSIIGKEFAVETIVCGLVTGMSTTRIINTITGSV